MSEQNKDKQAYTVDTLITTMGLADADSLVKKMNVQGNYIIGNQCDIIRWKTANTESWCLPICAA